MKGREADSDKLCSLMLGEGGPYGAVISQFPHNVGQALMGIRKKRAGTISLALRSEASAI